MKLIYIANIRIPTEKAHGYQIIKMSEAFTMAGIELELVLPSRKNEQFRHIDIFDHYRVYRKFKIKKIKCFDPDFIFSLLKNPDGIYIKFQILFFALNLFVYLLFKKSKKDYIFYTRDEYLLPLLQLFSKKVVWEAHSLPEKRKHYLKYFKKCRKILVLTEQIKKSLVGLGLKAENILVSPDAVDLKIFDINLSREEARLKLSLPQDKIILGYTGSFKTKGMDKGINDILKSLKKIGDSKVLFIAVGGTDVDISYYYNQAKDLGVDDRVTLLNQVKQDKLAIYQKAFDILMMPFPDTTHYRYYMSPLKMFEYMAAKRPIIAADLPSIREVLDENNCIMVKPDDVDSLVQGLEKIMYNKDLGNKLAGRAYDDAKNYTWEKRAENIIKVIY